MSKKQLINRIIQIIIVLFGISLITFTLIYLAPGDPVRTMYAASGMIPSEDVIQQIRESMGLNDPFFVQYWNWLSSCLRGDFGISYSTKKPVIDIILLKLVPTLKLAFMSLIVMLIIAVPFGILAAVKKNKVIDFLIRGTTFLGLSIPNFWVGLMLLYFIALKFKLLPVVSTGDGIEKMILPVLTLAFSMAANNYAGSIGLPGILIERGCMGKWSKEEVEEYKIDVKNVLKELNVLSGEKVDRNNYTKVITNTIYENSMYTGCWYSNYKVGDIVSKGDELGTVKDYFGNILHTCIAKVDGIILYQVGSLSILKDGPMITYGEI